MKNELDSSSFRLSKNHHLCACHYLEHKIYSKSKALIKLRLSKKGIFVTNNHK